MSRLLVVEDEPTIALGLRDAIARAGFDVEVTDDGREAERLALGHPYDLIVLDLTLPGQDGFDVCRALRAAGRTTAIIVLTVRHAESDKVRALELGADDYVTKPFSPVELIARIRAVLRRASPSGATEVLERNGLRIDFQRMEAVRDGRAISLTPTEFRIVRTLLRAQGRVVGIKELMEEACGLPYLTRRVVYTHMNNIRKKIEANPNDPRIIVGVRGIGYRLP